MKQLVSNYTINTTNKTITLPDFTTLVKERILLITDTTNQTTVYQFNTSTGVTVSGNVITFTTFSPTANTDTLQIYYDTKQGDPHYDDWQLLADTASNQVIGTGSITVADTAVSSTAGQSSQNLLTGTPTAGSTYALAIPNINSTPESLSSIVIQILGTFVGTYSFERSPDGGTTWTTFSPFVAGLPLTSATGTLPGQFHGNIAGVTNVRVRCTAYTSGTINVRFSLGIGTGTITVGNPLKLIDRTSNIQATIKDVSTAPLSTDTSLVTVESPNSPLISNQINGNQQVQGNVSSGANDSGNPVKTSGVYNSTLPTFTTGQRGNTQIDINGRTIIQAPSATGTTYPTNAFAMGIRTGGGNLGALGSGALAGGDGTSLDQGIATGTHVWNGTSWDRSKSVSAALSTGVGTQAFGLVPAATALALTSYQATAVISLAVVKNSAGRLHRIIIQNPNASLAWLQIFNSATTGAVTLGTTAPIMSLPIPASGVFEDYFVVSDTYSAGITIAATTTANGSTAVGTGLFVSLGYI